MFHHFTTTRLWIKGKAANHLLSIPLLLLHLYASLPPSFSLLFTLNDCRYWVKVSDSLTPGSLHITLISWSRPITFTLTPYSSTSFTHLTHSHTPSILFHTNAFYPCLPHTFLPYLTRCLHTNKCNPHPCYSTILSPPLYNTHFTLHNHSPAPEYSLSLSVISLHPTHSLLSSHSLSNPELFHDLQRPLITPLHRYSLHVTPLYLNLHHAIHSPRSLTRSPLSHSHIIHLLSIFFAIFKTYICICVCTNLPVCLHAWLYLCTNICMYNYVKLYSYIIHIISYITVSDSVRIPVSKLMRISKGGKHGT